MSDQLRMALDAPDLSADMSPREMEQTLLALQENFQGTRDPQCQDQYRALHARWVAAK